MLSCYAYNYITINQNLNSNGMLSYSTVVLHRGHSVSNQQGILDHLSDFDETYCVCSTYGTHHPYQLLTTYIT